MGPLRDIDPVGGRRMIHNEFTYGYRVATDRTIEGFYDVGSVWLPGASSGIRHSLGVGLRQGIFVLTLAVPANAGRLEAVLIAGFELLTRRVSLALLAVAASLSAQDPVVRPDLNLSLDGD